MYMYKQHLALNNLQWLIKPYNQTKLILYIMYIYLKMCKQISEVKSWLLYSNTWNLLTVCKNVLSLILRCYQENVLTNHMSLIHMHKQDLALNNLLWLVCPKPKPNQTKPIFFSSEWHYWILEKKKEI